MKKKFDNMPGDFDGDVAVINCPTPGKIQLTRFPVSYIVPDPIVLVKAWFENNQIGEVAKELSISGFPLNLDQDWEPNDTDMKWR